MNWKSDRWLWASGVLLVLVMIPFLVPIFSAEVFQFFGKRLSTEILLGWCLLLCQHRLGEIRSSVERRFWKFICLALLCWLVVRFLYVYSGGPAAWISPITDSFYLLFYVGLLTALTFQPEASRTWKDDQFRNELLGTVLFAGAILTYFVIIPSRVNPEAYWAWRPAYLMYLMLDMLLVVAAYYRFRGARSERWRWIYGLFALTCLTWFATDLIEYAMHIELVPKWTFPGPGDLLWFIPFGLLMVTCRSRDWDLQPAKPSPAAEEESVSGQLNRAVLLSLPLFAVSLPVAHLLLYSFSLLDEPSRAARDWCVVVSLLVVGAIAWHHQLNTSNLRRRAEQRYRELFEEAPVMYLITRNEGGVPTIEDCNALFPETVGYHRDEIVGQSVNTFLAEPSAPGSGENGLYKKGMTGCLSVEERQLRARDGRIISTLMRSGPLTDSSGKVVGTRATLVDITERKQLEEKLVQSQKMEAMGLLAGGIAHDFNNILQVIRGQTDLLKARFMGDCHELNEMAEACDRAVGLTRQLLAFSRNEMAQLRVIDVNRAISATRSMLRRLIRADVDLRLDLRATPATILIDPSQLEQILLNLAINARDAMPNGGVLWVQTVNAQMPSKPERQAVKLVIRDSGKGMSSDVIERAFQPFFTTKEEGQGTGLGLATVYGVVERHHGEVELRSELGNGTEFELYFPLERRRASTLLPVATSEVESPVSNRRVLLVEDDEAVRRLAATCLSKRGCQVMAAGTAGEALDLVEQGTEIDLLLTDLVLPDQSGSSLAQQMSIHQPGIRILFMSGYADDPTLHNEIIEQGIPFLPKPFSLDELWSRVGLLLAN